MLPYFGEVDSHRQYAECFIYWRKLTAMLSVDERTKYYNRVILFLAMPQNRDKEFGYDDLAIDLRIPQEYIEPVQNALWNSVDKCINAKRALKNPLISITDSGLKYANKLEELYFEQTGLPIFTNFIDMTIQDTCELIFQKHKESSSFSLVWHSDTFKPNTPRNVHEAKEIMLRKEVIFYPQHSKIKTILNDDIHSASSYKEAVTILEEKKLALLAKIENSFNQTTSNTTNAPNSPITTNGGTTQQTFVEPKKEGEKNLFLRIVEWAWEQIKKPFIAAIGSFIIGFISGHTTSGNGKSDNQLDSLRQSQSDKKSPETNTSSNKTNVLLDSIQK